MFAAAAVGTGEGAADPDTADLVALLFFTGARLNEVLGMEWSEVDFAKGEWRIPPGRSKIGRKKPRSRVIPLMGAAIEVLSRRRSSKLVGITTGQFVFPAARGDGHMMRPTKHLTKLKLESHVRTFMPHGIRHTLRARLARLGVPPHVAEQVLGHSLRGMEGQYTATGVEFLPEMREALERWAATLKAILEGAPSAVRA